MKFPWVNTLLLVLLALQFISGFFGLKNGMEARSWLLWSHGIIGYGIALLLAWKGAVVVNAWRRGLEWSVSRVAFAGMLVVLIIILLTGFFWTFDGPVAWLGFSLMTWHAVLALLLAAGYIWHVFSMRFILRHPYARDRTAYLRLGWVVIAGWLARGSVGLLKESQGRVGATRRFTGSYETLSFSPDYPPTIWLADRVPRLDPAIWRLEITNQASEVARLDFQAINALPALERVVTLDCTGGWFSTQAWHGVLLGPLLDGVGWAAGGRSLTIESETGYQRRFPIEEARTFMLALRVAGLPLSPAHGFPVRLVAPGRRGYDWVKWVSRIRINTTGATWQAPLPLQ